MAQSLDLYIDVTKGELLTGGSAVNGALPTLTRNDSYNLRLRLRDRDQSGFLRDSDTSGIAVKLGIGGIEDKPTDGQFKLTLGAVTSTAISFNATTTQVYNAISAIAGTGVNVATFGSITQGVYLITSATANTALSFGGDALTLFPTSSVLINTRRNPATGIPAQQIIKLVRTPAVYADTFIASPTAGVVSIQKIQSGSVSPLQNEVYNLSIGKDAEGGSLSFTAETQIGYQTTTGIPIGASAASFAAALNALQFGTNNISVDSGSDLGNYTITFSPNSGIQDGDGITVDSSGVIFAKFLQSAVTLNTAGIEELFASAGTDQITPKLEVELTQSGTPKTILQTDVTIRKDLIATGSAVPAAQASYLTAAESFAAFVSSQNNVGFYGATAISKPTNINVVSGLINLGLFANGATYGVLPQSPYTVTALASVTFGTVNANDQHYRDVTVTGANVNNVVLVGLPSAVSSGAIIQGVVYKANTVCLSCINADNGAINVNTATYRITVIGY